MGGIGLRRLLIICVCSPSHYDVTKGSRCGDAAYARVGRVKQDGRPFFPSPTIMTTDVEVFLDIPYTNDTDPMHTFDLFVPQRTSETPAPLICFVHGGAWRS
jgi:hypothetical protein